MKCDAFLSSSSNFFAVAELRRKLDVLDQQAAGLNDWSKFHETKKLYCVRQKRAQIFILNDRKTLTLSKSWQIKPLSKVLFRKPVDAQAILLPVATFDYNTKLVTNKYT